MIVPPGHIEHERTGTPSTQDPPRCSFSPWRRSRFRYGDPSFTTTPVVEPGPQQSFSISLLPGPPQPTVHDVQQSKLTVLEDDFAREVRWFRLIDRQHRVPHSLPLAIRRTHLLANTHYLCLR